MDPGAAIEMTRRMLALVVILIAPVLLIGLTVGVLFSLFQAVTQVREHTISFVPKILAMMLALLLLGPWMIERMVDFGTEMFSVLP